MMKNKNFAFLGSYIKKQYRLQFLVVSVIAVIELILTVRGLLFFNLERLKHQLYLCSYLFLLLTSSATLAVLFLCKGREKYTKLMVMQSYVYSACLIAWSTLVTCIDCTASGDSGVMVFIMVCISVGVLTLIHPLFYSAVLCACGATLVGVVWALRGQPYSMGFYINFVVFIILAIFINAHNYSLNKKEYESSEKLQQLSYTDQLTGIYNRRHLDQEITKHANSGQSYLFMIIDVDDFKHVNDTHGHAVGDECLILIAKKLSNCFGEQVYRFGGDEFAIITDISTDAACQNISRINAELVCTYDGIDLHISAGAYRTQPDDLAGDVFIRTDRALYQAKADGKNMCRVFKGE